MFTNVVHALLPGQVTCHIIQLETMSDVKSAYCAKYCRKADSTQPLLAISALPSLTI